MQSIQVEHLRLSLYFVVDYQSLPTQLLCLGAFNFSFELVDARHLLLVIERGWLVMGFGLNVSGGLFDEFVDVHHFDPTHEAGKSECDHMRMQINHSYSFQVPNCFKSHNQNSYDLSLIRQWSLRDQLGTPFQPHFRGHLGSADRAPHREHSLRTGLAGHFLLALLSAPSVLTLILFSYCFLSLVSQLKHEGGCSSAQDHGDVPQVHPIGQPSPNCPSFQSHPIRQTAPEVARPHVPLHGESADPPREWCATRSPRQRKWPSTLAWLFPRSNQPSAHRRALKQGRRRQIMMISEQVGWCYVQKGMKESLLRKIAAYRDQKGKQNQLSRMIQEQSKKLEQQLQVEIEKQNDFAVDNYASEIDRKQQRYFQDIDELQNIRFKVIEKRGTLETLEMELSFQKDSLAAGEKEYLKQIAALEEVLQQVRNRFESEKAQREQLDRERCQRHIEHIEKLTKDNEELIIKSEEMLSKRRNIEGEGKKIKEKFEDELARQKGEWVKTEGKKRQQWEAETIEKWTTNTLKGLQPQINSIVEGSRRDIVKIEERYELLKNDYKDEMNKAYESNLKELKRQATQQVERVKREIIEHSDTQYRQRMEKLETGYETEKARLRSGKEAELRTLEAKRKSQTEEFMSKNKDYLLNHLQQVKKIKASYEKDIRELDSALEKQVEQEESDLKAKYKRRLEQYGQQKKAELRKRIDEFRRKYQREVMDRKQDLVDKMALENQVYEEQLKVETKKKVKQYREQADAQVKSVRKTLQSLLTKQQQEKEGLQGVKGVKQEVQNEYEQLRQENEYLKRREIELQREVVGLKAREGDADQAEIQSMQRIEEQWQEQIRQLEAKIKNIEEEYQTQETMMRQRDEEEHRKYEKMFQELQTRSLETIKRIKEQVKVARVEKEKKAVELRSLAEMEKKMKALQAKRRQ